MLATRIVTQKSGAPGLGEIITSQFDKLKLESSKELVLLITYDYIFENFYSIFICKLLGLKLKLQYVKVVQCLSYLNL